MCETTRADLKHNYLKQIILRLDYQGVLEEEIEGIIPKCKSILKDYCFSRFNENINSQYDVNVPNSSPDAEPQIRKKGKRKIYSFFNESQGHQVDICKDSISIKINSTHYCPFENYFDYLYNIYNVLINEIDFITFQRLGLRKINECVVFKKQNINKFFSKEYFSYFSKLTSEINIASRNFDFFVYDNYKVNLLRAIQSGKIADKNAYVIQLDIDVYVDTEESIKELLLESNKMKDLNDLSFKLYINSITDEFLSKLKEDDFVSDDISGVENNE